jgi:uncharacterized membrane protein YfcA
VRCGRVRYRTGLVFGFAGMVGAFAAGRVAKYLPSGVVLVLFAAMMLVTSIAMLRGRGKVEAAAVVDVPVSRVLLQGLGVGILSGTVGAGGGFLIVPALVLLGGLSMTVAVGTSLLVIAMNSFAGFAGYVTTTPMNWSILLPVTALAIVGSVVGGSFAARVEQQKLRRGFGWFVIVMATFMFAQELPKLLRQSSSNSISKVVP